MLWKQRTVLFLCMEGEMVLAFLIEILKEEGPLGLQHFKFNSQKS